MTEKYDVVDPTRRAGGGEYPTQDGFGWTNGVALALSAQVRRAMRVAAAAMGPDRHACCGVATSEGRGRESPITRRPNALVTFD
jgi:alpha,alpha-trehalase